MYYFHEEYHYKSKMYNENEKQDRSISTLFRGIMHNFLSPKAKDLPMLERGKERNEV